MMRRIITKIALVTLLSCFMLTSVLAGAADTLTLAEAYQLALLEHIELRKARNQLEQAKLTVKQEIWRIWPEAEIETVYGYDTENRTYPANLNISIKQAIPTKLSLYGSKVAGNIEAAVWDQLNQEMQLQITTAKVIFEVTEQYLAVLKAERVVQLEEETLAKTERAAFLARELLKIGHISKSDQLEAARNLAKAKTGLQRSRNEYQLAQLRLAASLGKVETPNLRLQDEPLPEMPALGSLAQLQETAVQKRLELQQLQLSIRKAERNLAMARNDKLPVLSLDYSKGYQDGDLGINYNFLNGELTWNATGGQHNRDYQKPVATEESGSLKLKLTWDLGFGKTEAIKKVELDLKNAKHDLKLAQENIIIDVKKSYLDYELAKQNALVYQNDISYYQQETRVRQTEYKLGSATSYELAETELALLQAQVEAVKSQYDQLIAYQKLRLGLGELYSTQALIENRPNKSEEGTK